MTTIAFTVPAVPVAQPRPRATLAHGGKGARIHEVTHIKNALTGERKPHPITAYKATVRMAAEKAYQGPPLEGPLMVRFLFLLPRPGRLRWKTKAMPRVWHESGGLDLDNLEKATLDSLTSILWADDSQVCDLASKKLYAAGDEQPRVEVVVTQLVVAGAMLLFPGGADLPLGPAGGC